LYKVYREAPEGVSDPPSWFRYAHGSATLMVPLRSWFRYAHGSATLTPLTLH